MSHTKVVKTTSTTTRGRGARNRGQGRGHSQNRRYTNTNVDGSEDNTFQQSSQNYESDSSFSNRKNPHGEKRYSGQNQGNNNPNYFRFDNFSGSNESEGTHSTGSEDSNKLPKHASNPIFVHELMHRFTSMLPESDLLEPEPQANQPRAQQRVQRNEHRAIGNDFTRERVEHGVNRSVRDSRFDEHGNRRSYVIEENPRNNYSHRSREDPRQYDQRHSTSSRGPWSTGNAGGYPIENNPSNNNTYYQNDRPRQYEKGDFTLARGPRSAENARGYPIENNPSNNNTHNQNDRPRQYEKGDFTLVRGPWSAENARGYPIENNPSNNNTHNQNDRLHQHEKGDSTLARGPRSTENARGYPIENNPSNINTHNQNDRPRHYEQDHSTLLRGPRSTENARGYPIENNPSNNNTHNRIERPCQSEQYRSASPGYNSLNQNVNTGAKRKISKPPGNEKRFSPTVLSPGPHTQERMNILMKYGFEVEQNTNEENMSGPDSSNTSLRSCQEPTLASSSSSVGTHSTAKSDRFNKPDTDLTLKGRSVSITSKPTSTPQNAPITAHSGTNMQNLGAQFIKQLSQFEQSYNKLNPDSIPPKRGIIERMNTPTPLAHQNPHVLPTLGEQFIAQIDKNVGLNKITSKPTITPQNAPITTHSGTDMQNLGAQFIKQLSQFEQSSNKASPDSSPPKRGPIERKNTPTLAHQKPHVVPTLGEQFIAQRDKFAGLNNSAPRREQKLNSNNKIMQNMHQPIIAPNQNQPKSEDTKNIPPKKQNQSQQTGNFLNFARPIGNNCFPSDSSGSANVYKQLNSGQNQRHPTQSMPISNQTTFKELELNGQGVSGAGPFNIVRPLADNNQVPIRRSDALNRIEQEYKISRREFEEKEREKLEKKRQEKLRRYNHVDNGHQGYRLNEAYLDEAAGYAPDSAAQFLESEEDARERQQLQLQIDAIIFKEKQEKELQLQKKREEEKLKQKLEKNKHIDEGYKLGHQSNQESYSSQNEVPRAPGIIPPVQSQDIRIIREKQQEKLQMEAILHKEKEAKDREIQQKKEEEHRKQKIEKTKYIDAGYKLGSTPILDASNCAEMDKSQDQDPLTQEEERLRQEAIFFQEQARKAEERLRELNKRRKKNSEEVKDSSLSPMTQNNTPGPRGDASVLKLPQKLNKTVEPEPVKPMTQSNTPGPRGDAPVLKLPQQFKKVLNEIVETTPVKPIIREVQTQSYNEATNAPVSCVLKSKGGPLLVLRPSSVSLQQAVAGRYEIHDEFDKLGHSALYQPNVHPEPEFQNNRFDSRLTLVKDLAINSTGAIPKKKINPQKKTEPPTSTSLAADNHDLGKKVDTDCSPEPEIDHEAEMRAARLRMQMRYEQQLKRAGDEAN